RQLGERENGRVRRAQDLERASRHRLGAVVVPAILVELRAAQVVLRELFEIEWRPRLELDPVLERCDRARELGAAIPPDREPVADRREIRVEGGRCSRGRRSLVKRRETDGGTDDAARDEARSHELAHLGKDHVSTTGGGRTRIDFFRSGRTAASYGDG